MDALMVVVYLWHVVAGFCTGIVARYGMKRGVVYSWAWVAASQIQSVDMWLSLLTVAGGVASLAHPSNDERLLGIVRVFIFFRYLSRYAGWA